MDRNRPVVATDPLSFSREREQFNEIVPTYEVLKHLHLPVENQTYIFIKIKGLGLLHPKSINYLEVKQVVNNYVTLQKMKKGNIIPFNFKKEVRKTDQRTFTIIEVSKIEEQLFKKALSESKISSTRRNFLFSFGFDSAKVCVTEQLLFSDSFIFPGKTNVVNRDDCPNLIVVKFEYF